MSALRVVIDGVEYRPAAGKDWCAHSFQQLMRVHREGFGWTLDQAAAQIGCSKSYLHGMESGESEPSLRMAYAISLAYDISMKRLALSLDPTSQQNKGDA